MFNVKIFVLHIVKIGLCTFICVPPINFLLIKKKSHQSITSQGMILIVNFVAA